MSFIKRLIIHQKRLIKLIFCILLDFKLLIISILTIYNYFFFIFFLNRKIEKKYRSKKEKFKNYCNQKLRFNHKDLFSNNIPSWLYIFYKFSLLNKKINVLEVGSYEGRSSFFLVKNLKKIKLTCVDTFKPFHELQGNYPSKFSQIYKNFKFNTKKFKNRVKTKKQKSKYFFYENKKKFSLIYIDGSHEYKDVLHDSIAAFKICDKNGIIIFDDFFWENKKTSTSPVFAILKFLSQKRNNIKILYVNYQIIIQKIN